MVGKTELKLVLTTFCTSADKIDKFLFAKRIRKLIDLDFA